MRRIVFAVVISGLSLAAGCGGGGGSNTSASTSTAGGNTIASSASNVAALNVDGGPNGGDMNQAFTTVTVCAPNSPSTCVTINHVWVDTGSVGLRIPASVFTSGGFANGATVLNALQNVSTNASAPISECVPFGFGAFSTFSWGSVRSAIVEMGGPSNNSEVANSVPINILGDTAAAPDCQTTVGGTEADSVTALGANGLLGVGSYRYDCDVLGLPTGVGSNTFGIGGNNACASASTPPPGTYYSCPSTGCVESLASASEQVQNPVALFPADNNGVILELVSVPNGGQGSATGSLVFGIGTQSNNGLGSAVVLTLDPNFNNPTWTGFATAFNGKSFPNSSSTNGFGSFLDSGSTSLFFLDQPQSGITSCASGNGYCPSPSPSNFNATNQATGGNSRGVQFSVSNADTLVSSSNTAFSDLASPVTSGTPNSTQQLMDQFFDWGLPFFYGRNVYTSIWGATMPNGVPAGPFWAY